MGTKVSIIVPVYNAEKGLDRCIDSVLKQDFEDFELFLVDDGSEDASGSICDRYAKEDGRIHVIHKENTGVSDSRNQAIGFARGDYLAFLDSDDWLAPDAIGLMVGAAGKSQCDMVITDFYRVSGERVSHKGNIPEDGLLSQKDFASHMLEKPADFYYGVLWNKLYRRDIVEKHHLRMDTEISWCEDFMFNLEYIRYVKDVYVLRIPVYYYVKTPGSLVSQGMSLSKTIKMKRMVFEYYNKFYKDVFDEEDYEKSRLMVYRFLLDAAGDGIVPPAILPGSKKLGDERTRVSMEVMESEGILLDAYRERKMLDYFLERAAVKNDLSLEEARILFYFCQPHKACSMKEMAEFTNMTRHRLSVAIQKLISRRLVKMGERQRGKGDEKPEENAEASKGKKRSEKTRERSGKLEDIELLPEA